MDSLGIAREYGGPILPVPLYQEILAEPHVTEVSTPDTSVADFIEVSAQGTYVDFAEASEGSHWDELTDPAVFNINHIFPADPPTSLLAAAGIEKATLSWGASEDVVYYSVRRSADSGGPYTEVGTTTDTTYIDTGLTPTVTYYYVVVAVNNGGDSQPSNEASATASSFPSEPGEEIPFEVPFMYNPITEVLSFEAALADFPSKLISDVVVNGTCDLSSMMTRIGKPRALLIQSESTFTADTGTGPSAGAKFFFQQISQDTPVSLVVITAEEATVRVVCAGEP
jgi:hypothetical protein